MRKGFVLVALAGVACLIGSTGFAAHTNYHCLDCHQPHRNFDQLDDPNDYGVPLWNGLQLQDTPLPTYVEYSSKWFDKYGITVGQPTGSSRLCLGCHDGTGGHISHIFGREDLKNSHPISINYDQAKAGGALLNDPDMTTTVLGGTLREDMLDQNGDIQCVSCHEVHKQGLDDALKIQVAADDGRTLCKTCHDK